MALLEFLLFVGAFICFVAEFIRSRPALNLIALGLALWVLVYVIGAFPS
jgi:hypothetical protein